MGKVLAKNLRVGDKIMPPPRELQLWMRRHAAEKRLPEAALHLTVTQVGYGPADKRGPWLVVRSLHTPEWTADYMKPDPALHPFTFKVRPDTPWQMA